MNDFKDFTYYVVQIWKNKKSHAAIMLFIYFIFFVFVISGIRATRNNNIKNESVDISNIDTNLENKMNILSNFSKKKTYNIKGSLNDENYSLTNTTIKVFRYDYKYYIVDNNKLYNYDTSTNEKSDLATLDLDIKLWDLNPKAIYDMVILSDQIYEEDKEDGTKVSNYIAPLSRIYKYIPCDPLDVEKNIYNNINIEITVHQLKSEITYVEIDFTPFVRLMNSKTKSYVVKMNF